MSTLTKEQEKTVDAYGLKMLKNGIKQGVKTNRKLARQIVTKFYKRDLEIKSGPKKIVFVDSPQAAIKAVAKSQKVEESSLVSEIIYLNFWTWWVAYYSAGINILGETEGVEKDLIADLAEYETACMSIHAILPCENVCFVIEYPKTISIQNNDLDAFKLHSAGARALEYNDGTGFCWLNGVEVPDYIALTPASKLSVTKVMAETNVDVRREGLARIPLKRLLKDTNAVLLDKSKDPKKGKHWDYELYKLDFKDGKTRVCLRMYDVASKKYPIERVEDTCTTVLEALAMRDGEDSYIAPKVRT